MYFLSAVMTLSLLLFSCNKEVVKIEEPQKEYQKIVDGTYTGSFTVKYGVEATTAPVTLEFNNGRYACSGKYEEIPAGGSGTFTSKNDTVSFSAIGAWGAVFDGNLILNGKYKYSVDGKKLIISADRLNTCRYEYNVEKN